MYHFRHPICMASNSFVLSFISRTHFLASTAIQGLAG